MQPSPCSAATCAALHGPAQQDLQRAAPPPHRHIRGQQGPDLHLRDLTVVGALLRTHTLLAVVPTTSVYYAQVRVTSMELVQCLLAFTQRNVGL